MQLTERTQTAQSQWLLMSDIEIEGWWTSLSAKDYDNATIIALYRDHATAKDNLRLTIAGNFSNKTA